MAETRAGKWLSYLLSSDPVPNEVSPTSGVDVLIPGLDALTFGPTPTGCSLHAKKATLVAFYAASSEHVKLLWAHMTSVRTLAEQNHNYCVYGVLGAADSEAAAAVLDTIPANNRVILAGESELKHRASDDAAWVAYLAEAVLVEFVPMSAGSDTGTWLLPSSGDACLGKVPRGAMSLQEWKDAINSQPRDKVDLTEASSDLPFARLASESGIVASGDRRVPIMQRTIEWVVSDPRDVFCWPDTRSIWSSVSTGSMPSWAITSGCARTIAALTQPPMKLDRQLTVADTLYDVSLTLASLLSKSSCKFDTLRGVIGPLVLAGRDYSEPMRVVEWSDYNQNESVLMLLPETYMQLVFPDYNGPTFDTVQWLSGFVCVSNSNVIELNADGRCHAEADEMVEALGPRLWRLPPVTKDWDMAVQAIKLSDVTHETMRYHTQQEAAKSVETSGKRIHSSTHTIFRTTTSSKDHLTGLRVRWVFAADRPTMPTLDADNRDGGAQLEYETVA